MASPSRKLQSFDDDDIVRYSMGPDVPIVGLVRDRIEYREMREIALINGVALGLPKKRLGAEPPAGEVVSPAAPQPEAPTASATVGPKPEPPVA